MNPSFGAICLAVCGSLAAWERHIILVVGQASLWVVARGKVNISTQWRCKGITVRIWKTDPSSLIIGVLDTNTMQPIRISRIGGRIVGSPGACPLNWLYLSLVSI